MRANKSIFFVIILCIAALFANARAADDSPVTGFVDDAVSIAPDNFTLKPLSVAGNSNFNLRFCEVSSSKNNVCTTPRRPLKQLGKKTSALTISPKIEGEWRFSSDYAVQFTPKKSWQAKTNYKLTFLPELFPNHVKLSSNSYNFTTQAFYLLTKYMNYLQDPNDPSKKLVTAQLAFNYPVDHASLEKALHFSMEGANKLLSYKAVFAEDGMSVNITVPIASLEKQAQFVQMNLADELKTLDGSGTLAHRVTDKGAPIVNEFSERTMVPSLYDYLQISNVQTQVLKDSHYVPKQMLVLESNTKLAPEEFARFLELRVLPEDKAVAGLPTKKKYAWSSPAEVTPEIRATLPVLATAPAPDSDASTLTAFNFSAEAGRYMLVTVKKGLPAAGGYELGRAYETILPVPALPREVKVMAEGALLSLSGEKTLSILSLGIESLDYKIGRIKEENLNHLISQTHGNFAHPNFRNEYEFNENNLSKIFHETRALANMDPKKPNYSSFNFSPYLEGGKGLFLLKVTGTTKKESSANDERFILVTDLGLIIKENLDGTRDVFVQSIGKGDSVRGVEINVLGLNGESVASAKTDWHGHATLPNLDALKDEKQPVAFVARKGDDLSFLPYGRKDRELNYSKFDVGGTRANEGLRAYLFTDRGIYRPGETAHFGMIVKAKDWAQTMQGLPLILEITNPRGQVVSKQTLQMNKEGLLAADFVSSETGATGVYNASLYLGRDNNEKGAELGNVPLRVEEFQPDRMKMTSVFLQDGKQIQGLGWVKPAQLQADVTLMQLYGAPAGKRRVTGKLTYAPGGFGFESFKGYDFIASNSVDKSFDQTLAETVTSDEGKASFPLDLSAYKNSTFRLTFFGEGFEPDSGRSVKTAKTILVSPLDYVLGVKADGNLSYINPGDKRSVSLLAVNQSLTPISATDITVDLKRIKEIQSLLRDNSGNYSYQSSRVETLIKTEPVAIAAKGTEYALPTEQPGSYTLEYKNAGGVVLARVAFTVVGEANEGADFTRDAAMQVTLDKPAYNSGDEITLNIQSPYTGTGLITIETDHVHAWQWFSTDKTSSQQSIKIPKDFEGKGFINIQFTRDLKSKEIFRSPLSFAVLPFNANIAARDQKVELTVPKDAKPGDTVSIQYRTKNPGKVVLYAVDEGILLYARYQNPNPIDHFLMKRALEVKTSQIMDLLLPEYSVLKSLSQTGGDGFANDGKNLNPFKRKTEPPVAYWSGILESGRDDKHWSFTIPPYFNGGVRIVAVSVSDMAMGTAFAGLNVHGPLIVTPSLPLFAAPGDSFYTTVTIANHVKGSGKNAKVTLNLEASPHLQVLEAPRDGMAIAENEEVSVPVKLKATDTLGSGSLRFTANLGSNHFTIEQTLSIRPPLPSFTSLISGFAKDKMMTVPETRRLYPELADMKASVSTLPISLIGGLRDYLVTYPYGCTEQMTSQNFPNVALYGNTELIQAFGWKPEAMDAAIRMSFEGLRERQNNSGGWGMWNYYSEPHSFISSYVMHFLLEAKEKNLPIPEDVFDTGLNYLKKTANEMPHSIEEAREKSYAIYLLTRSGEITTNYIPHLTQYLDSEHRDVWHDDLTAIYLAATYQLMQMQPEADALLARFHLEAPVRYTDSYHAYAFYDSLTRYSQYVYLLAKHFPARLATMDKAVIYRVANYVGEEKYNTVSSAYAVLAIDAYVSASKETLGALTIHAMGLDNKEQALSITGERLKVAQLKAPASSLTFGSSTPGFFYQIASSGYDKTLPHTPLEQGLELTRSYLTPEGKPVQKVKLGDRIDVVFTLRSGSSETIKNVAIVDLLPGGFDVEPDVSPVPPKNAEEAEDTATPKQLPIWSPESRDTREDRVVLYGSFEPEVKTYRYRLKATARGTFIVPPAYAESMYDGTVKVRGIAGSIEVQ